MRNFSTSLVILAVSTTLAHAQGFDFLYTTSQNEVTISGSGGTVLRNVHPNDIMAMPAFPCPQLAEKWSPRQCMITMAGDEDGDDSYWEPGLMGSVDALITTATAGTALGEPAHGLVFAERRAEHHGERWSGRPGQIGRIVRTGAGDGRVQHFIRQEMINQALGLPIATVIDVDAAAFGNNQGLFLLLDTDIACSPCGGLTLLRDGDVFCIPPGAYTMTAAGTIGAVVPNSAVRVYTEAQMDAFALNVQVAKNAGACVNVAVDTESLDIDFSTPSTVAIPGCTGTVVFVPTLTSRRRR